MTEQTRGDTSRPLAENAAGPAGTGDFAAALSAYAAGVTLVTIAEGRDDIGTTVSAFCPVSLEPPLVLVSLIAASYPAELLGDGGPAGRFAVCLLAAGQRMLAGRFAAAGRPSARRLLDGIPHRRGAASGALIPEGGLAALECEVTDRVPAGDHLAVFARVAAVPYVSPSGEPLIRFAGRYPVLTAGLRVPRVGQLPAQLAAQLGQALLIHLAL